MEPKVLDLVQLARIQGTHSGFLYQHLYAVACLLAAPSTGVLRVRVERDEDVELELEQLAVYVQVKKREGGLLAPSDIDGMLERFEGIRAAHRRGERPGAPRFALVSNIELGPTLATREWPTDVLVVTPSTPAVALVGTGLLVPAQTLSDLVRETQAHAEAFRLSVLKPESLVAKLVGLVSRAASGDGPDRSFATVDLERFCELFSAQLRTLPRVSVYRPQSNEPSLPDDRGSLIVVGHAGDGKTAWASEVAALSTEVAVYVPCSSAPGEQLASRIVQATVATLVQYGNVRAHDLVLPGRNGSDALAVLDRQLAAQGIAVMVIVDDCHHISASALTDALRAAPGIRWLLLGRPCDALGEVAALFSLPRAMLEGWNDDVIASLLSEAECSTAPVDVAALRQATDGAPLFVLHAIRAIARDGKDTGAYARALVAGTTTGRTAQEALLEGAVQALDLHTARVATALASIEIGLSGDEWTALLHNALHDEPAAVRRALRRLVDQQVGYETRSGLVAIHDAFRPLLVGRVLTALEAVRVRETAANLLRAALLDERASERIVAYVRTLAALGRLSQIAEIANAVAEWLRETGTISEVRAHLEVCVREESLTAEDRFWALDTLAFLDIEEGEVDRAASRLPELGSLSTELNDHARAAHLHKQVLVADGRGDLTTVRSLLTSPQPSARHARILRYHGALAEGHAGNVQAAVLQLLDIAREYLAELNLTPNTMFAKSPEELRVMMPADADRSDVRHLADCYDAIVRFTARHPQYWRAAALPAAWSLKFYDLAGATRSVLRAGQEMTDVMLCQWDDPDAARAFMEQSLLPALGRAGIPDMAIPVRAHHAVICAHCGDFDRADELMEALTPYAGGLSAEARTELETQRRLIKTLRARGPLSARELNVRRRRIAERERLVAEAQRAMQLESRIDADRVPQRKVGRNERCPCGSGLKYKKCHGVRR